MRRLVMITVVAVGGVLAACVGPQGSHREGKSWPTEPSTPKQTQLRGTVSDLLTTTPIEGAQVHAAGGFVTTTANGTYTIPGLTMDAVQLMITSAGYDTVYSFIPLPGGDIQHNVRLNPRPAAIRAQ
jgi:hypothetical protein